jgi:hypothetical protein
MAQDMMGGRSATRDIYVYFASLESVSNLGLIIRDIYALTDTMDILNFRLEQDSSFCDEIDSFYSASVLLCKGKPCSPEGVP